MPKSTQTTSAFFVIKVSLIFHLVNLCILSQYAGIVVLHFHQLVPVQAQDKPRFPYFPFRQFRKRLNSNLQKMFRRGQMKNQHKNQKINDNVWFNENNNYLHNFYGRNQFPISSQHKVHEQRIRDFQGNSHNFPHQFQQQIPPVLPNANAFNRPAINFISGGLHVIPPPNYQQQETNPQSQFSNSPLLPVSPGNFHSQPVSSQTNVNHQMSFKQNSVPVPQNNLAQPQVLNTNQYSGAMTNQQQTNQFIPSVRNAFSNNQVQFNQRPSFNTQNSENPNPNNFALNHVSESSNQNNFALNQKVIFDDALQQGPNPNNFVTNEIQQQEPNQNKLNNHQSQHSHQSQHKQDIEHTLNSHHNQQSPPNQQLQNSSEQNEVTSDHQLNSVNNNPFNNNLKGPTKFVFEPGKEKFYNGPQEPGPSQNGFRGNDNNLETDNNFIFNANPSKNNNNNINNHNFNDNNNFNNNFNSNFNGENSLNTDFNHNSNNNFNPNFNNDNNNFNPNFNHNNNFNQNFNNDNNFKQNFHHDNNFNQNFNQDNNFNHNNNFNQNFNQDNSFNHNNNFNQNFNHNNNINHNNNFNQNFNHNDNNYNSNFNHNNNFNSNFNHNRPQNLENYNSNDGPIEAAVITSHEQKVYHVPFSGQPKEPTVVNFEGRVYPVVLNFKSYSSPVITKNFKQPYARMQKYPQKRSPRPRMSNRMSKPKMNKKMMPRRMKNVKRKAPKYGQRQSRMSHRYGQARQRPRQQYH